MFHRHRNEAGFIMTPTESKRVCGPDLGGGSAVRPKQVAALFMVDPVDSGPRAGYPSALPALRRQQRRYGMVGAGRTNMCNPEGSNYKVPPQRVPAGSATREGEANTN